ncbi:MAG TPA: BamA/TamA family outer membrane protein [Myxococcaceae bacterium]|nr:BamA/TamA family outer membrane protein [Myxococcaceae bacterium]
MHSLLLLLLAQASAPGATALTPPSPEERPPSAARPEDFTLSEPGSPVRQGTAAGGFSLAAPDPEAFRLGAKDSGFDFVPIPVASFNSDTGFGFGLVLLAYFYAKDYRPYRHGFTAQFFATTTGFQGHYITWDAPHLLGPVRVEARLEFHKDLYAPYYGPGNHTFPGQFLDGPDKFFGYLNVWTSDWIRFRIKPLGDAAPLTLYAGYQYRYFWITPYAGSNLDQERPNGVTGGRNGAGVAGILFDTRDDEQNTHSGFLVQAAARMARPWTGSQFSYQGVTFGTRIFFSLGTPRLVLALHGEVDHLWGDVPFWEWNQLGGISSVEGLGGLDTVRGVPRNRYGGNTKALGNVELRWATVEIPWGPAPLQIGLSGFFDTGRVWQPGQPNGTFFDHDQWHSGAGGGLRLMRRAAVIRADFGFDLETKRTGVYIAFGQLF